jgi:hypothetical protein
MVPAKQQDRAGDQNYFNSVLSLLDKGCASKREVMYPLKSLCSINLQAEPHPWTSYELAKQAKLRLCAADANQNRCRSERAPVMDPHRINEQA